jgi:hypothetical protein
MWFAIRWVGNWAWTRGIQWSLRMVVGNWRRWGEGNCLNADLGLELVVNGGGEYLYYSSRGEEDLACLHIAEEPDTVGLSGDLEPSHRRPSM